jgi:hypothetical protein
LYEAYENAEAFDAHRRTEHFRTKIEKTSYRCWLSANGTVMVRDCDGFAAWLPPSGARTVSPTAWTRNADPWSLRGCHRSLSRGV